MNDLLRQAAERLHSPVEIHKVAAAIRGSSGAPPVVDYSETPSEREFSMTTQFQTVNPALLGLARDSVSKFAKDGGQEKQGFVMGGDPAMAGGDPMAGGAPPGGDPMAGGAPPPGGDPMAAGGAPPPGGDPMAGGGDPMAALQPMIQQAVQQAMASQGGGAGGAPGEAAIKPKIDINIEVMQMKKLLAKLCDAMGVQIPAADMVATPEDLTQMAQGGPGMAASTPDTGGGAGGSAISPIEPMQAASPELAMGGGEKPASDGHIEQGSAFDSPSLQQVTNRAQAILAIRRRRAG